MRPKAGAWLLGPLVVLASALPFTTGMQSASALSIAAYGPTGCTETMTLNPTTLPAGMSITVTLAGTGVNDNFAIVIAGVPGALGTIHTDAAGNGSATFVVPASTTTGAHTMVATDAVGCNASAPFTATAPTTGSGSGAGAGSGTAGSAGTGGNSLAFTGTDAVAATALGAGALCVGGLLVLSSRKRRAHSWGSGASSR